MRLTTFSDYSLRVLIYFGVHGERLATIGEIARAYGVSENHLAKVVHHLAQHGYVETTRGKGGGMRLARPPTKINVGAVVRATEENLKLVECFDKATSDCRLEPACGLKGLLGLAIVAFFASLERYTLSDLLVTKRKRTKMLVPSDARPHRGFRAPPRRRPPQPRSR
jgi:Rrf2 family nitric oxide-sensitive transcriptional repressor